MCGLGVYGILWYKPVTLHPLCGLVDTLITPPPSIQVIHANVSAYTVCVYYYLTLIPQSS